MTDEEIKQLYGAVFARLVVLARTNYFAFYTLMGMRPEKPKVVAAFQQFLCEKVQRVLDGIDAPRQTTSTPPQHGKTDIIVRAAIAWAMGRYPQMQIGLAAYDFALVEEISNEAKQYIEHPWYQLVFPEVEIDQRINRIVNWGTTGGARLRAVSFGRKLVGRRVDWFIGDDIYPGREEVESKLLRKKVERWFFADCYSRLAPKAIVWLVGTRWHPEDLAGHLHSPDYVKKIKLAGVEEELYEHLNLPALAEDTDDPLGREHGEALCPELGRTVKFLKARKGAMPPTEWNSQFRGVPQVAGSDQVDLERLNYIDFTDLPKEGLIVARGWDLATEIKKINDFSASAKCAWHPESKTFYIIDVWRAKLPWPKLKPRIVRLSKQDRGSDEDPVAHPCFLAGVEGVSGFTIGFHEIRDALRGEVRVRKKNPPKNINKLNRAMPWINWIEDGRVYLVNAQWNQDFVDQLGRFPTGDHDDMVDAVSISREMLVKSSTPKYA
tara:strand:- start:288 stop:1769 length:1482 start_codon:yes stop_codon:yes gene_type:complete